MKNTTTRSDWSSLDAYLREIAAMPALESAQAARLGKRACKGDVQAQEQLISAHLRLVVRIAQPYACYGLPLADLIAEGNLALIRAAQLYNPKFGTKFSNYATTWIKQRLHRALTAGARAVRIPVWRAQRLRKLGRITEELASELGRAPSADDIAGRLGISAEELAELQGDRFEIVSFDAPIRAGDEDTAPLRDIFADENAAHPSEGVSAREDLEQLMAGLAELDDRELEIVSRKHGLHPAGETSFRQLAHRFDMSHEWVRRIAEMALVKVRRAIEALPRLSARERSRRSARVRRRLAAFAAA